jgi:hypothetical protein
MTAPARFTKADTTRLLKSAKEAGFTRIRLEIDPYGHIILDAGNDDAPAPKAANPLDRILKAPKKA